MRFSHSFRRIFAAFGIVLLLLPGVAAAQQSRQSENNLSLIRDAEIEETLRAYTDPIFRAAGLGGVNVQVFIISDPQINAFVAGGRYIFINTGTLIVADKPEQIVGVIAHETGHLAGGHVYRLRERMREAQMIALITTLIAAAAGAASGEGGAAAAGALGGQRMALGHFLSFAQTHERIADEYALEILDQLHVSAQGLLEFFEIMRGQEALLTAQQDPYLRTHPLTQERIGNIRQHVENSPYADARMPERFYRMHARMRGKLIGFLRPPRQVFEQYRDRPESVEARYALAVAHHRSGQLDEALGYIDSLIEEQPEDPYFIELKGQILFESGRINDAVTQYEEAVRLKPDSPLIRASLGHALIERNTPEATEAAIPHLREAVRNDPFISNAWRLLAVAYGRQGDIGRSSLALAEYYFLLRDLPSLRRSIARAEEHLDRASPAWQRLQDIKSVVGQVAPDDG